MNSIDFLKYTEFPVSAETYSFMQDMIRMVGRLASIAGNNVILSGCNESGLTISAGYVIIDGEILPFVGGTKTTYVIIDESKTGVQVYDTSYEGLYTSRNVKFGTGTGQVEWASFKRVSDILALASSLSSLAESFSGHVSDHRVDWSKVDNKPSSYPPSSHNHVIAEISDFPAGIAKYCGEFTATGTPTKVAGEMSLVDVTRISQGRFKLSHGIGHKRYIVLGVGKSTVSSLVGMPVIENTYCEVLVADDSSPNDEGVRFIIITF